MRGLPLVHLRVLFGPVDCAELLHVLLDVLLGLVLDVLVALQVFGVLARLQLLVHHTVGQLEGTSRTDRQNRFRTNSGPNSQNLTNAIEAEHLKAKIDDLQGQLVQHEKLHEGAINNITKRSSLQLLMVNMNWPIRKFSRWNFPQSSMSALLGLSARLTRVLLGRHGDGPPVQCRSPCGSPDGPRL